MVVLGTTSTTFIFATAKDYRLHRARGLVSQKHRLFVCLLTHNRVIHCFETPFGAIEQRQSLLAEAAFQFPWCFQTPCLQNFVRTAPRVGSSSTFCANKIFVERKKFNSTAHAQNKFRSKEGVRAKNFA